jgi:flagellar motor switch protein FliM
MLTQQEIDALLNGALEIKTNDGAQSVNLAELLHTSDEDHAREAQAPTRNISAYNFWSPDRFSKEQMRAVELVHEDLTERLTTSLPTFLRTSIRPRLVHSEQGRFHDFLKDFPPNTLFHMVTLAPLPGQSVLTLSPNMSYMVLEQRLGGKIEGNMRDHALTDIDQSLLRGLVEHMLGDIKAAWSKVINLEPTLEDSTTNQHWVQMMMGNERVMLLTFELNIQSVTGTMSIFIPFSTLKPIANVLNPHIWIAGRKEQHLDPAARETTIHNLSSISLTLSAILGETSLRLGDILQLSIGDVIQLDSPVQADLTVQVANLKRIKGKVGRVGNRLGVRITGIVQDASNLAPGTAEKRH